MKQCSLLLAYFSLRVARTVFIPRDFVVTVGTNDKNIEWSSFNSSVSLLGKKNIFGPIVVSVNLMKTWATESAACCSAMFSTVAQNG